MTKREQLVRDIVDNGKRYTWQEYADMYGADNDKQANDWYRYYKSTGKYVPDDMDEEQFFTDIPKGARVTKAWGKPGSLNVSLSFDGESEQDIRNKFIEDIAKYSPKVDAKEYIKDDEIRSIAYEISLPDFHFGRESVGEAKRLYLNAVAALVNRVRFNHNIEKFILPIGNDLLNSDNLSYTTTKGTPQFDVDDWQVTFRAAWQTIIDAITFLSEFAPVDVIVVQGNHDYQRSFYLGDVVAAWFRNDENVTVDNRMEHFKFYTYGVNMIMYEHGEIKAADYPLIMATEQPQMFANATCREVHTGHWHKEMVNEYRGVKVRFQPSIAPTSDWEKRMGYRAFRTAQALKFCKDSGLIGYEQVNHKDNK